MVVWVLFRETNTGSASEESDGFIEAIYATEQQANAARLTAAREARDAGHAVWFDPDQPDRDGPANWSHDWRVEPHEVIDLS